MLIVVVVVDIQVVVVVVVVDGDEIGDAASVIMDWDLLVLVVLQID